MFFKFSLNRRWRFMQENFTFQNFHIYEHRSNENCQLTFFDIFNYFFVNTVTKFEKICNLFFLASLILCLSKIKYSIFSDIVIHTWYKWDLKTFIWDLGLHMNVLRTFNLDWVSIRNTYFQGDQQGKLGRKGLRIP